MEYIQQLSDSYFHKYRYCITVFPIPFDNGCVLNFYKTFVLKYSQHQIYKTIFPIDFLTIFQLKIIIKSYTLYFLTAVL